MNDPYKLLITTLQAMTGPQHFRSQSAQLRYLYPVIERALSHGLSRSAILEALRQEGIVLSLMSFDKALYRIRKSVQANGSPVSNSVIESQPAALVDKESLRNNQETAQTETHLDRTEDAGQKEDNLRRERLKKHPFYHLSERNNPDWVPDGRLHNSVPDKEKLYGKGGEE